MHNLVFGIGIRTVSKQRFYDSNPILPRKMVSRRAERESESESERARRKDHGSNGSTPVVWIEVTLLVLLVLMYHSDPPEWDWMSRDRESSRSTLGQCTVFHPRNKTTVFLVEGI